MKSNHNSRKNISQFEYLELCSFDLNKDQYLKLETRRKGIVWAELVIGQQFKCYYCNTDIRNIQKLILKRIIKLRKRGAYGYSGLHFELDHKNSNKEDNSSQNLVAACYYCNNDKSNTISEEVFLNYFGPQRKIAFDKLFQDNNFKSNDLFVHNLSLNTTK